MAHIVNKIDVLPRINKTKTMSYTTERARKINKNLCKAKIAKQKLDAELLEREQKLVNSKNSRNTLDTIA